MHKLINYTDNLLLYVNKTNGLSYKLLIDKPLTASEEIIINSLGNYVGVLKICYVDIYIIILKLDGSLEALCKPEYDPNIYTRGILREGSRKPVKDLFLNINNSDYILYILFNDNSMICYTENERSHYYKICSLRKNEDYSDVLCVDITKSSIQITKLNGTKILITVSGRTIIEDCFDSRID